MAAVETSTVALTSKLIDSLIAATSAFPADESSLLPPSDGISLLDVKNELLLSYLQNLVFLIILRLRHGTPESSDDVDYNTQAIRKLIEQRVYLEKGVRPLEGRLKYQIDKVLRAAGDAEMAAARSRNAKATNFATTGGDDSDDEGPNHDDVVAVDDLSYRPNPTALLRKGNLSSTTSKTSATQAYQPPRITPTAMPGTSTKNPPGSRRPPKSTLLDEYITTELSSAPTAQPSIGSNSTILHRGRKTMSSHDREKELERTAYEEQNLTRLPAESKADRRKARLRGEGQGGKKDLFGGEDWSGLGGLGDRIGRSVSGTHTKKNVLERRVKRGRDTIDSVRGDGVGLAIGESFEKRRKIMRDRAERKGKRR